MFALRLPKQLMAGAHLVGAMTLPRDGRVRKAVQYPVKYMVVEWSKITPKGLSMVSLGKKKSDPIENETEYKGKETIEIVVLWGIALFQNRNVISTSVGCAKLPLFGKLVAEYPEHLPLQLAQLKRLAVAKVRISEFVPSSFKCNFPLTRRVLVSHDAYFY